MVLLYGPLLSHWLQRYGVHPSDIDDLVQDVLMVVSTSMKTFAHNGRPGAFRSWLRTILINRLRNFWRSRGQRPQVGGGSEVDDKNSYVLSDGGFRLTRGKEVVVKVTRSDTKETPSEARMITPMHLTANEQQNLLMQGGRISEAAAKALEAKADLNPDDIESRLELLGFYFSKSTLLPEF